MTAEQELNRQTRIKAFIEASKIETWTLESHIRFIMAEIRHALPAIAGEEHKAARQALADSLAANGLGGNQSQFRQWLENPKGANLLKRKESALDSRYADV